MSGGIFRLISWIFSEIYESTFSFEFNLKRARESLHTIENFHMRFGEEIRARIKTFTVHTLCKLMWKLFNVGAL